MTCQHQSVLMLDYVLPYRMAFLVVVRSLIDDRRQHAGIVLDLGVSLNRVAAEERILPRVRVLIGTEEIVVSRQFRTTCHHLLRKFSLPFGRKLGNSRSTLLLISGLAITLARMRCNERSMLQIEAFVEPRFLPLSLETCGRAQVRTMKIARRVNA